MLGAFMYFLIWFPFNVLRRIIWRWSIDGLQNIPPAPAGVVLASNHLNWFDVILIGVSLPLARRPRWIAKSELFEHPISGWWLRTMGVIPIRRGKRDMTALHDAEDALKAGALLIIFPEGHRSKTGGLIEGRGGAIRLAANSGAVIMPTAVYGTENGLGGLMRRKQVSIRFGAPYHPEAGTTIPADQMHRLTTQLMLRIAELLPKEYRGVYHDLQDERMRRQAVGAPE